MFAVDVAFASPGAAAAGGGTVGQREWKVAGSGQSYRDWRAERLGEG